MHVDIYVSVLKLELRINLATAYTFHGWIMTICICASARVKEEQPGDAVLGCTHLVSTVDFLCTPEVKICVLCKLSKKGDAGTPVQLLLCTEMQPRKMQTSTRLWLTLQKFIRASLQSWTLPTIDECHQLRMNVVSGARTQIRVWGGDAGKEWIQGRYHFECMCQFGIRKDCFGLREPNLPPPHQQNKILLKPQKLPPQPALPRDPTLRHTKTQSGEKKKKWRNKYLPPHSGLRWSNAGRSCALLVSFLVVMYIPGLDGKKRHMWANNGARVEN